MIKKTNITKLTTIVLSSAMVLSLSGCGADKAPQEKPQKPGLEQVDDNNGSQVAGSQSHPGFGGLPTIEITAPEIPVASLLAGKWIQTTYWSDFDNYNPTDYCNINCIDIFNEEGTPYFNYTSSNQYSETCCFGLVLDILEGQTLDGYNTLAWCAEGNGSFTTSYHDYGEQYISDSSFSIFLDSSSPDTMYVSGEMVGGVYTKVSDDNFSCYGEVINNGSYFVRIDNRVYFRVSDDWSLNNSALLGEFSKNPDHDSASVLAYYNIDNGEFVPAFIDCGDGNIFYHDGIFYLNNIISNDWTNEAAFYQLDIFGNTVQPMEYNYIGEGTIIGMDDLTGDYIVSHWNDGVTEFIVYNGTDALSLLTPPSNQDIRLVSVMDGYIVFCCIYYNNSGNSQSETFYIMDLKELNDKRLTDSTFYGNLIELGHIDGIEAPWYYPEFSSVICDGSVYIIENNYSGSAHFYSCGRLLTASVDTPSSLEFYESPDLPISDLDTTYLRKENGRPVTYSGSLNNIDFWTTLYKSSDQTPIIELPETIVEFDGYTFAVVHTVLHNPAYDYGWKENYNRLATHYSIIDNQGNEQIIFSHNIENTEDILARVWYDEDNSKLVWQAISDTYNTYDQKVYYDLSYYLLSSDISPDIIATIAEADGDDYTFDYYTTADDFVSYLRDLGLGISGLTQSEYQGSYYEFNTITGHDVYAYALISVNEFNEVTDYSNAYYITSDMVN